MPTNKAYSYNDMSDYTDQEREQVVFRYLARYGQRPQTENKYREAIEDCQRIDIISLTVSEIARKHGLQPEAFRNQLKRHFPDLLHSRAMIRSKLGFKTGSNYGMKEETALKYAAAVELLRDPAITVREAALRNGISYQGLQGHLIFHHKDIAEARMLSRTDAISRPASEGGISANGGIRQPRPSTVALYAPAIRLYRTTDLPVTEIARRCKLSYSNLCSYIAKWHRLEMAKRKVDREAALAANTTRRPRSYDRLKENPKALDARKRYSPAIALLNEGKNVTEAADLLGVNQSNLFLWLKRNHPDVLEKARAGMMRLPTGKMILRTTYDKYAPVASYISSHPTKSTREVALKFDVPVSSLIKHMSADFPDIWLRHCRLCALKRQRKNSRNRQS